VYDSEVWNRVIVKTTLPSSILATVCYGSVSVPPCPPSSIPCLQHVAGGANSKTVKKDGRTTYNYPSMNLRFAVPGLDDFDYATDAISHTRNLAFLKRYIRGADFDLEAIWEEDCYFEFEDRSVSKTMGTMVQEPYVNHIPTVSVPIEDSAQIKYLLTLSDDRRH
jgi:carboxymethylenebutenolidase